jgi:hypothetical protein
MPSLDEAVDCFKRIAFGAQPIPKSLLCWKDRADWRTLGDIFIDLEAISHLRQQGIQDLMMSTWNVVSLRVSRMLELGWNFYYSSAHEDLALWRMDEPNIVEAQAFKDTLIVFDELDTVGMIKDIVKIFGVLLSL